MVEEVEGAVIFVLAVLEKILGRRASKRSEVGPEGSMAHRLGALVGDGKKNAIVCLV